MAARTKDKKYRELHKKIADEFGLNELTINYIRSAHSRGLSFKETLDLYNGLLDNRQREMQNMLKNMKVYDEVINTISTFSEETLKSIIDRDLTELND